MTPDARPAPEAPVITIDGPTASGKGTIALGVARALGWHTLDSGALYRTLARAAMTRGVALDDPAGLARLAAALSIGFAGDALTADGQAVGDEIRQEAVGAAASRIAVYPAVRACLLPAQRAAARTPGLVADGRDMGTVVFPVWVGMPEITPATGLFTRSPCGREIAS